LLAAALGLSSLLAVTKETALEAANPAKTSRLEIRVISFFHLSSRSIWNVAHDRLATIEPEVFDVVSA